MTDPRPLPALLPIHEQRVEFYGDAIIGVLVESGDERRIYVPVRLICENLGLSWGSQRNRIYRDEVLREELRGVFIMNTPGAGGGTQETLCLPIEMIPGFLFGITTSKVRPDLQEKILRYRRECYRRLWDAFKHEILPVADHASTLPAVSGAHLAYELATAVQNLAREQMAMEERLGGRIDRMAHWAKGVASRLDGVEGRLGDLELHLGPTVAISEQQAAEVALAVKNVGRALSERGTKPGYSQVYGEMYRRYGISSYKNLPQEQYAEVLAWLKGWHEEVLRDPPTAS